MGEQDRSDHATNVTETDANITAVGDIVDDKTPHLLGGDIVDRLRKSGERPHCYCALFKGYAAEALEAADEIERLRYALLIAAGKLSTTDAYAMLPPDAVHEGLLALADKEAT
jgi:hypothetical protein